MNNKDTSGATMPVPMVYFIFILMGLGVDYFWPFSFLPQSILNPIGYTVIILSFLLFGLVLREFSKSNTSIDHRKPTTEVIVSGPFRYSRNPVYVSLTMLVIGIAIVADSIWVIVTAVPSVLIIHYFVILKEETYLLDKFGDEYQQYMRTVRRWI